MAGGRGLTSKQRRCLLEAEKWLALLNGTGYFTEEQWIQQDFLIHRGEYVFTNGPPKQSLVDFFEPVSEGSDEMGKYAVGEPVNLLLPDNIQNPDNDTKATISEASDWGAQETEHETTTMNSPTPMASMAGTSVDEVEARARKLQEVENHEKHAAAEWEQSDDEEPIHNPVSAEAAQMTASIHTECRDHINTKFQQLITSMKPTPNTDAPSSNPANQTKVCHFWATPGMHCRRKPCDFLHSDPEAQTSQPPKFDTSSWRQQPNSNSSSWRQNPKPKGQKWQKPRITNQVNGRLEEHKTKAGLISTQKHITCYLWYVKNSCPNTEDKCVHSHHDTGELYRPPFWETENDEGEDGSATSVEEKTDLRSESGGDSAGSGSANGSSAGEESKVEEHGCMGMQVDIGGGSEDEKEEEKVEYNEIAKLTSAAAKTGWGDEVNDEVNLAVEEAKIESNNQHCDRAMILGASVGGWGDDNMEQIGAVADDGWNPVPAKKTKKAKKEKAANW